MTAPVAFTKRRTPHLPKRYDPRGRPFAAALAAATETFHSGDFHGALVRCAHIESEYGEQPWTQMLLVLITKDRLGERDRALATATRLVERWPGWLDGRYNLGAFLQEEGRWEEALHHLRRAIAIDATHVPTMIQLGICHEAMGDHAAAERWWTDALAFEPLSVRDEYHLSPVFAGLGHMREFMRLQELRWEAQESYTHDHGAPPNVMAHAELWQGDDLTGHDLLVLDEQGAGDCIQFARYLPVLCDRARSVFLRLKQPALARLLQAIEPRVTILAPHEPMPLVSRVVGIMSLFHRLAIVQPLTPAFPQGYIPAEKKPGGRVGLCWAGAKSHPRDAQRSMSHEQVRQLLDACPDVEWVDFTFGREPLDDPRVTPCPTPSDYLDTVSHLARCRSLVTVDTSVAHLAGGMGIATHVMVTTLPDMRWGLEGTATPWYDSWRLVRQERPNDWSAVIARIAEEYRP